MLQNLIRITTISICQCLPIPLSEKRLLNLLNLPLILKISTKHGALFMPLTEGALSVASVAAFTNMD